MNAQQNFPHQNFRSTAESQPLPNDLIDLASKVEALPAPYRDELLPAVERVIEFTRRRRKILGVIQDALHQLRLDMKYLIFDVEATRRERDQLREQLEGQERD
jgi:hypothetical protein